MSRFRNEINSILEKVQAGDKDSFKELYDATYSHLKRIAMMYAEDKSEWEDILVESYIRAFKYVKTANLEKDGYNWLCKIVQNVAFDFSKKKQPPLYQKDSTFEEIEQQIFERDFLITEMEKLPEKDQKLLYMRFWEDKSFAEIASELQMQKSTVHKRAQILLKQLKVNLGKK